MTAIVNPDKNVRLVQTQNGRTVKYPPSNDSQNDKDLKRNNIPDDDSDTHNAKTTQKLKYKTRYLPSKPDTRKNIDSSEENKKKPLKNSFVSVSNSLSGNIDDNNQDNGKFASTYFTKSSTCGHFTFSCNIVYGSEGRSRICRPKQTNQKC